MAIDFPNSPSTGQTFTVGPVTWKWDGSTWKSAGATYVSTATSPATYNSGTQTIGVDQSAISIQQSQVANLNDSTFAQIMGAY